MKPTDEGIIDLIIKIGIKMTGYECDGQVGRSSSLSYLIGTTPQKQNVSYWDSPN